MTSAFITGLAGPALSDDEAAFLRDACPAGVILFARNCCDPAQLRRLIEDVRTAVASANVFILIDQEGGRVQRLKPPHWRQLPPAKSYGTLYASDPDRAMTGVRQVSRLVAHELQALGITMNCAPVLDLPLANAHAIIGDRAFGPDVATVVALGRSIAQGHLDAGVVPVIKHIPGHGRAMADSHLELPIVHASAQDLRATDFAPFQALANLPAAMTAHVTFPAYDRTQPASTSRIVTQQVIRDHIGFDGLLMSDDLSMRALSGTLADRTHAVISAGSDIALHCNGELAEMVEVAETAPELAGKALRRFEAALGCRDAAAAATDFDIAEAEAYLKEALSVST